MSRHSKLIPLMACVALLALVLSCAPPPAQPAAPAAQAPAAQAPAAQPTTAQAAAQPAAKRPKVGVLWDFLQVERRVTGKNALEKYANQLGFDMVFQNANGDEKLQMQQGENLITQGVDLIVILAQNADASCPLIEQAHKANIKVIAFDRLIGKCAIDYFVGMDNDVIGDLMANYVYKLKPTGNYALVNGATTDPNVKVYRDGWLRVIQNAVDKGDIKIVSDTYTEKWDPNNAMKNVENFLTKQGDKVDVILAMNDGTAGGSVQALKGRNLNGKVLVTGQDGEMAALQRIVEGDQAMTVYKPDDALALVLAQTIMKVLKNEPLGETKTLNNGLRDVPAVLFQPLTVDKNNLVETLVKPGYVKMEDVYKNVPKDQWPK
jgi:D-xylose transport system substrate-binding protein